jgi:hypothetical protein
MKILLNLLPVEKKTEMLKNKRFRMIVAQGSGIIFLGFSYCCALLGISFLLSVQLSSTRGLSGGSSFVEEKNEIESYEAVFRETNAKASEISQLLAGHVLWEKFFQSLEAATPPGVLYTKMLSKNDFSFSASGTAPNRDALLLLEKNMNESDCFRSKDGGPMIPLSNKLVKENIDFQLDAMIERSCLVGIK